MVCLEYLVNFKPVFDPITQFQARASKKKAAKKAHPPAKPTGQGFSPGSTEQSSSSAEALPEAAIGLAPAAVQVKELIQL